MTPILADDFQDRLQAGSSLYRASRVSKFRRGHVKLLYSKLLELTARKFGIGIKRKVRLFWSQEMTVVYPETSSLAISRYGFYEEGLTRMAMAHLKPGMTVLDVGAHYGCFTLLGAWLVGESGQVHSFEPTPNTFEVLRSNTEWKTNVYLNQMAVASEPGVATLNDYGHAFSGYNSIYKARMYESMSNQVKSTEFQAPAIALDEYVDQKGLTPHFIKIDAESAEYQIFAGMEEIFERFRPIICIEVGDMDIEGVLPSRDLVLYLIEKGYDAYDFKDGEIAKHSLQERYEYDNIMFLPRS